jgi:hypothetical protein
MPRLVYLAGLALVVLTGAFLLPRELTWRPGPTAANVARIRPGMTMEEVEALMGGKGRFQPAYRDVNAILGYLISG